MNQKEILTIEAKIFLNTLAKKFSERIEVLLKERKISAKDYLSFTCHDKTIRNDDWEILPPPKEILDRRVEITGPPVRKMIINALNSGANVYMSDFEDSNAPTFQNCIDGQINLRDAVAGTIEYTNPKNGKNYTLNDKIAVLFVRPRGLHLLEKNYFVDDKPIPACLFDYGLYFFHNWKTLQKKGSRPYFYLPKLEHQREAALWADVFGFTEKHFGLQNGTIKATVLIETLPAAFQMDEILWELRMHSAGLNCGRWDYIFSFIKTLQDDRTSVLPDRNTIGMSEHFMRAYSLLLIQTCHKRGAHAIGGMAAQIPIRDDPEANHQAMEKVRADKLREVQDGHDGTWVAHPALVGLAREVFDSHMPEANQINNQLYLNYSITKKDLLCVPRGQCTEEALIDNINIGFQYLNAWINGNGCVPINNLMEDAATAEISRAQIWQWQRFKVWLANGKQMNKEMLLELIDQELEKFKSLNQFYETKKIFIELCTSEKLVDFLTPICYDALLQQENSKEKIKGI